MEKRGVRKPNGDDLLQQEATPYPESSSPATDSSYLYQDSSSLSTDSSFPYPESSSPATDSSSPYPECSSPATDSSSPYPDSTSSHGEEHLGQTWLEMIEAENELDLVADCEPSVPNPGQTAPDPGQTAPDPGQTPHEPAPQHQGEGSGPFEAWLPPSADRPPRKDLAQVMGTLRVWVRGLRRQRVEPAPTARLDEEKEKPLGRPSCWNPFGRKMAWAETKATIDAPLNLMTSHQLVIETEEEGEEITDPRGDQPTQQAEGKGLSPRFKWLNVRFKGLLSRVAAQFQSGAEKA